MDSVSRENPALMVEASGGVVHVTLDQPERRNALSRGMLAALGEVLEGIAADPAARVVVLGARGPVFCSGHDLREMVGRSEADYRDLFSVCSRVMRRLRQLPQPVIARVQGPALAAGCQLVASCDLAVAGEGATFSTPGVKIGLFCTTPMVPLVRSIPPKVALEMLLTGATIPAARALALGLVNRVVPTADLDAAVSDFTHAILSASPAVIQLGKAAYYDGLSLSESSAYERATAAMIQNALLPDAQEGITAFLDKRNPDWRRTD